MSSLKVLVTGGAGYKGVVLTARLLDRGHRVTILDNFMHGHDSVLHLVGRPGLSIVSMDVRGLTAAAVADYDVIYHLAGISGMPACAANPYVAQTTNVQATRLLASCLGKEQLLINASTTSFYGAAGEDCDETVAVQPVSLYGKTKYEAECIVQERENSISLRFATVFGVSPRMRNDLLVNDFTWRAIQERSLVIFAGHSKRTFMHIQDAITAYLFALDHADQMRGGIFNAGDERLNFSKVDIAQAIAAHTPVEIIDSTLPDRDVRNFLVSFRRLCALGYQVQRSLDDGIRELHALYSFYNGRTNERLV